MSYLALGCELLVERASDLEPSWVIYFPRIFQITRVVGQWLNGLNFVGDYIFSREKKLQPFVSGFHWLSELWLVETAVFFCRCQTLGLHPEICWKTQSLEIKPKTTQNPSFPLPQKKDIFLKCWWMVAGCGD